MSLISDSSKMLTQSAVGSEFAKRDIQCWGMGVVARRGVRRATQLGEGVFIHCELGWRLRGEECDLQQTHAESLMEDVALFLCPCLLVKQRTLQGQINDLIKGQGDVGFIENTRNKEGEEERNV
jgi:hypothetical protein